MITTSATSQNLKKKKKKNPKFFGNLVKNLMKSFWEFGGNFPKKKAGSK
jgi:hypothetical protein